MIIHVDRGGSPWKETEAIRACPWPIADWAARQGNFLPPPVVRENLVRLLKLLIRAPKVAALILFQHPIGSDKRQLQESFLDPVRGQHPAEVSGSECSRRQLGGQPVVVMQPIQHRNRHKSATRWLRLSQHRIRIRYPVQSLMHAAVVVPADEFLEYAPKMPLIPDQHSVETLSANRPYQALNVCRCIGSAKWNRNPPDAHLLPEPLIVCRSARNPLPCVLNW